MSGDYLFVAAGGPLIASVDSLDPNPNPGTALTALKLGGEIQGSPVASASPEGQADAVSNGSGDTTVACVDLAFEPNQLSISADTDVQIQVVNNGALQHDWIVEGTDFGTDLLDGGDSADLTVNLPAGTYTYYCSVAGHREAGMQGTLTVE